MKENNIDIVAAFMAGVCGEAMSMGMTEKQAQDMAISLYKEAAKKRPRFVVQDDDDDEDDDEDTLWNRNKHWLLPTLVGTGAFLLGSNAERYENRPDRGYFENALRFLGRTSGRALGLNYDPFWTMMTKARNYGKQLLPDSGYHAESAPVDLLKRIGEQNGSGTAVA